jgi:putative DNA primase/helicase
MGFVVSGSDLFVGVDLDHCIVNDVTEPWAQGVIDKLNSYTETSPSGKGIRIFIQAKMPDKHRCKRASLPEDWDSKDGAFELYSKEHYLTLTGKHVSGTPLTVENRQLEVEEIYVKVFGEVLFGVSNGNIVNNSPQGDQDDYKKGFQGSDEELLEIARNAKNGDKFQRLFDNGDTSKHGNDDSAADQALVSMLAFYAGSNPDRIDRLFRTSALVRDKWLDREDYRSRTIEKALRNRKKFYSGKTFHLTDAGNAERLAAQYGDIIRFCWQSNKWLFWDGRRWNDLIGEVKVRQFAIQIARSILQEANSIKDEQKRKDTVKWAFQSESAPRIQAMLSIARNLSPIVSYADQFDRQLSLLNCLNGTINLLTSKLQPHNPVDMITKLAPVEYNPNAKSKLWDRFLRDSTEDNPDVLDFLQLAIGYSITGDTSEEKLFFVFGPAASGKSTFLEAIKASLGDYALTADFEVFLKRTQTGCVRNDIARLAGARLVISIEVEEGQKLAEGVVKTLTGGDTVCARFLYKEHFEFTPRFKLWLAANDAPRVRDSDTAMWRRIKLRVPFEHVIPKEKRDPKVKATLKNPKKVGSAILTWMVQGAIKWLQDGLKVPEIVEASTEEYRKSQEPLKEFFDDECEFTVDAYVPVKELRAVYEQWAKDNGARYTLGPREFNKRLNAKGCERKTKRYTNDVGTEKVGKCWEGITVRAKGQYDPRQLEEKVTDELPF